MAPVQAQIEFPVRKSSRRKTTKTADITDSNQTSTRSTRSNKKPVLSSVDNVLLCEEKSSRSSRKKSPIKSKSKNAAIRTRETTPTKALIPNDKKLTPSKRRAKNDIAESVSPTKLRANDNLPLSPSKLFDSNILVQGCNESRPSSARKQLSMGRGKENTLTSPRKADCTKTVSPSSKSHPRLTDVHILCSPIKQNVLSPRKALNTQDTGKLVTSEGSPARRLCASSKLNSDKEQQLLVSPRKRLYMSTTDKIASPHKDTVRSSPRKVTNSLKRLVEQSPRKSPRKLQSPRKLLPQSPKKLIMSPKKDSLSKEKIQTDMAEVFTHAKQALNTQQPDEVVCRDKEIIQIKNFLDIRVNKKNPGSLYISGAPGTGKTAVIKHLLEQEHLDIGQKVFINSMTVKSPFTMYKSIATEMLGPKAASLKNAKSACQMIQKHLTSSGKMVLIVLDEMDQLDSKNQEVLYTIFEWPSLPSSRLVLIGIANALDLTDRILPRLNVRSEYKPELLHFAPYTKEQIVTVIESRLQQTPQTPGNQVLDKAAMMFCARKVSAVAGDMRKALDICRRSVELAQLSSRKSDLLKLKGGSLSCTPQSKLASPTVGIAQVANVVNEVYGSANSSTQNSTFPLQQKLIVCTLLLMLKTSKLKELTLGKLHDSYCRVCKKRDVTPTDQSEFIGLCQLLETRGLISLKKAKDARMMKISLKLDAKELEHTLKDQHLISSVLNAGL